MSRNDPVLGFFAQSPKVRVVSILLWCLVVLLAFLTSWTAGVAASGTGGSIADRAPAHPIFLIGMFLLGFGAMTFEIITAKVRDDRAGWSAVRLLGSLGLGLTAGSCAYDTALTSFPAWWLPIMLVISIGILCIPAGVSRLSKRSTS